ncbi:MAG: hypothetical protein AAF806_15900 [Bacteroidota bacterium]
MKKISFLLFAPFILFLTACEAEYEQLHETIALTIDYEKDTHIFTFTPNLDLEGSFL